MKSLIIYIIIFFSLNIQLAQAQDTQQYPSVVAALDATTDYELELDQIEVLSDVPLHIRVSPNIMIGDAPEVIDEELKRALVRSILRAFIHTDVDQIKITVQPNLIQTYTPYSSTLLDQPKYTINIERKNALSIINRLLKVESFDQLVGATIGGVYMSDFWNPSIESIFYNDQGNPTLDTSFRALVGK